MHRDGYLGFRDYTWCQLCGDFVAAQFYILRKLVEAEWGRKGYNHKHAYIASLSAHTIVYKGQLMPSQARHLPALADWTLAACIAAAVPPDGEQTIQGGPHGDALACCASAVLLFRGILEWPEIPC